MQCQDVVNHLSAYLDGALDPAQREAVRAHLSRCPQCNTELAELRETLRLLKELPELAPPSDFCNQVMAKIDTLTAPTKEALYKRWLARINRMAKSSWYRTATVAAVVIMTLGITSLWEKDGNQMFPNEPVKPPMVATNEEPSKSSGGTESPAATTPTPSPNAGKPNGANETHNNSPANQSPGSGQNSHHETNAPQSVPRQVENFTPQPSQGMLARSAIIKLDVAEVEGALQAIGQVTKQGNGSMYSDYAGSEQGGTLVIQVASQFFGQTISSLQQLGTVITYLPTEQDLSEEHQQASQRLAQLDQREEELRAQLAKDADAAVEQELAAVQDSLAEQVRVIKKLEQRSAQSLITIQLLYTK